VGDSDFVIYAYPKF
jgi:coatomer subunit beta'